MAVVAAPASHMLWLTARIYIRGTGLGHAGAGLGRMVHSPGRGSTRVRLVLFQNVAIISSLGAMQLRLVAPSALAPALFAFRPQPATCLLAYCPA